MYAVNVVAGDRLTQDFHSVSLETTNSIATSNKRSLNAVLGMAQHHIIGWLSWHFMAGFRLCLAKILPSNIMCFFILYSENHKPELSLYSNKKNREGDR